MALADKYLAAAARAKRKTKGRSRMALFCQANPEAKGCSEPKSKRKPTPQKGEGGPPKGGGTRKKLGAYGARIPYKTG